MGISKKQSKMIQGLSILMMIYHHLFSMPENIARPYRSLLVFSGINVEIRLAWFCKMTIALFAFVSGYGLCSMFIQKCENVKQPSIRGLLFVRYKLIVLQILKLYSKFWLVFLVFMGIFFSVWGYPFDKAEYLGNLFAVNTSYNGTWWYMLQYVKMVMLVPLVDMLFTKVNVKGGQEEYEEHKVKYKAEYKGEYKAEREEKVRSIRRLQKICLGSLLTLSIVLMLCGMLFMPRLLMGIIRILKWFRISYLAVFLMGYVVRRFELFEKAFRYVNQKSEILQVLIAILLLVVTIGIRVWLSDDPSYARMDFLLTPFFVFGYLILMSYMKGISKLFEKLGELSTFMWLTHIFYYDEVFNGLVMITGTSTGMYIIILILSVITAFILQKIYDLIFAALSKVMIALR